MKKILIACSATALILGTISCNNKNANNPSTLSDSLTVAMGKAFGGGFASDIQGYISTLPEAEQKKISKESVLKGIQYVIAVDTADHGYMIGLQLGFNINNQIRRATFLGANINRNEFVKYLKQSWKADSFPNIDRENQNLQRLLTKLQDEYLKNLEEEKMKSPEAIQNGKSGDAFINKEKGKDANIKTSNSGLSYKIDYPGEGDDVITEKTRVAIKYNGKLIDGTIFEGGPDNETKNLLVSSFPPGVIEGLKLLKKGGKATFYIPGKLGFGGSGRPNAGIGPNATLVYDVEIIDINPNQSKTEQKPKTVIPAPKANSSAAK